METAIIGLYCFMQTGKGDTDHVPVRSRPTTPVTVGRSVSYLFGLITPVLLCYNISLSFVQEYNDLLKKAFPGKWPGRLL